MKKESIVEFDLDVYGWIKERERVMGEIEQHIRSLFTLHRRDTGQVRRTGCFHVELSLPEAEKTLADYIEDAARKREAKHVQTSPVKECPGCGAMPGLDLCHCKVKPE